MHFLKKYLLGTVLVCEYKSHRIKVNRFIFLFHGAYIRVEKKAKEEGRLKGKEREENQMVISAIEKKKNRVRSKRKPI